MPFIGLRPWNQSFFENTICPDNVVVPIRDPQAYVLNPKHNWSYNKLRVCTIQGKLCYPSGILPKQYPVFCKPIYNLDNMGASISILRNETDYVEKCLPGYMWSEIFQGEHWSTDFAIVDGKIEWLTHTQGMPLSEGTFDYWHITKSKKPDLENAFARIIKEYFHDYTGLLNFESIGGSVIEIHLRFANQWVDIYGESFIKNLVGIYAGKGWHAPALTQDAYSVPLFLEPKQYKKLSSQTLEAMISKPSISSIQLPFFEDKGPEQHSMPPGGMRVAIINGFELVDCLDARETIKQAFLAAS